MNKMTQTDKDLTGEAGSTTDPVCGMSVKIDGAKHVTRNPLHRNPPTYGIQSRTRLGKRLQRSESQLQPTCEEPQTDGYQGIPREPWPLRRIVTNVDEPGRQPVDLI